MGPKSQLDWLGVVSLWVGALVFAVKSLGAPLLPGAPPFLAAGFWNFVPLVFVSIALAIFIYRQFRPIPAVVSAEPEPRAEPRVAIRLGDDENQRTLLSLSQARGSAALAATQGSERARSKAFHELDAVMVTIDDKFGIKPLQMPESVAASPDYKAVLEIYVRYVDWFSALLREGHIDRAREKAASFRNPWNLSQA